MGLNGGVVLDLSMMSEKQKRFFLAAKRYIGYGGARGGGKSWAVRHKAVMLGLVYPGIKMLLLRRTYPELEENHVRELIPMLKGLAEYSGKDKRFGFVNGTTLKLGYCKNERDVLQYQGQEYDVIFIDEATQFTEYQFETLKGCLRGVNSFPKRIYLTCNPGGVGHEWVKRLFVSRIYKPEKNENPDDYEFIPASVYDNAVLMEKDPEYVHGLESLPDGLREAWLDGNWDMLAGRYFAEFDRGVHVVEPFNIPEHWRRYRAIDYGLDCLACVWVAVDELNDCWLYREYAESDKIISDGAADIRALSMMKKEGKFVGEKIEYTVAPPDLWARSQESGRSKADLFREAGLYLTKGNNDRESGWLAIKELLKIKAVDTGIRSARLHIFSSCVNIIEQLPSLQRDQRHPTDCMTEPHDITHLPDALRYFAAAYTAPAAAPKAELTPIAKHEQALLRRMRRR